MREALVKGWAMKHPDGWVLKPPDAIHLATAMRIGVEVFFTYEPKLVKYKQLIGIHVCEPYSDALLLEGGKS